MKIWNALTLITVMGISGFQTAYAADALENNPLEVSVEAALAPSKGFDDNDNIEIVLHGMLPNACYILSNHRVEKIEGSNIMRVRQFAIRRRIKLCMDETTLPDHMRMAVPFTSEISVGQLPAGDYQFMFNATGGRAGMRAVNVGAAPVDSVDNFPYASMTSVVASDFNDPAADIEVNVTGVLNSTCTSLGDVKVEKVGDVFVVLPTIKVHENVFCAQVLVPFEQKLNLGKATPGHYLIHVRSMNGQALNRIIEVRAQ